MHTKGRTEEKGEREEKARKKFFCATSILTTRNDMNYPNDETCVISEPIT